MIKELVEKNRSYRRFEESFTVDRNTLEELVDLARLSASAANGQPLKYLLVNQPEKNARIFPSIRWAAYLADWQGPEPGERPSAYIVVVQDRSVDSPGAFLWCDVGLACQNILLGAVERGLGGCLIGSFQKKQIQETLEIAERFNPLLIIALGKPKERVVLEGLGPEGSIKYYRDGERTHHVPKRALKDILL